MKKFKPLLILMLGSLIPLLFTATIPYALSTNLYLNTRKSTEHGWNFEIKLYLITLREGSQYTIDVDISDFWGMEISLRIGETPYMIKGFSVNSGGYTGETMHFTASKTGDHYIQVKINSGSGFYDIIVESGTIDSATGSTIDFFDVSYLMVLILPTIFILVVGLIILKKRPILRKKRQLVSVYKKVENGKRDISVKKEELMICPYCGSEIQKNLIKCTQCNTSLK
ncbi:MAG: hypothetical protein HWN81_16930 [Candidatus Lokiarchaeota archaeon]|nr:hypothetical protein [Candidatus Lokiarchaeota archaeon]